MVVSRAFVVSRACACAEAPAVPRNATSVAASLRCRRSPMTVPGQGNRFGHSVSQASRQDQWAERLSIERNHDVEPSALIVGLGCMRLSTVRDRDDDRAVAVILAALDAGATLLDTADAYCHDEHDVGHNERLVARALAVWSGDRTGITVATKGGIRRPKGAWVNDGRAKHLRDACDSSCRALGVDAIDLYQLHAVDPKTPLETSVRVLAALQREGAISQIGLCNVTVGEIERAREVAEIASVQ